MSYYKELALDFEYQEWINDLALLEMWMHDWTYADEGMLK